MRLVALYRTPQAVFTRCKVLWKNKLADSGWESCSFLIKTVSTRWSEGRPPGDAELRIWVQGLRAGG